jgi:hypothetical protein
VWHFFRKVNQRISKEKRIKPEVNFLISNGLQATARPERSMVQTKQTQVGPQILTLKVGGNQQIASPGNQQQALLASQRIRSFNGSMNNRGECSNNMRNGMPPIAH